MSIKQAIEALEELVEYAEEAGFDWSLDNARAALAALRSMPQGEPVAWFELNESLDAWFLSYSFNPKAKTRPLYATPHTEAVRMSEAEIREIADRTKTAEPGRDGYILPYSFARAVEQATAARLGVKMGDV